MIPPIGGITKISMKILEWVTTVEKKILYCKLGKHDYKTSVLVDHYEYVDQYVAGIKKRVCRRCNRVQYVNIA